MSYGEKFAGKIAELIINKDDIDNAIDGIVTDIDNILDDIPSIELERLQTLIINKMTLLFPEQEFDIYCETIDFLKSNTNNQITLLRQQEKLKFIQFLRSLGMEYFIDITIQIDPGLQNSLNFINIIHSQNLEIDDILKNNKNSFIKKEDQYMKSDVSRHLQQISKEMMPRIFKFKTTTQSDTSAIIKNTYLRMYSINLTR
ncbi:hypothetical protein HON22_00870 [Candidatus Peregrinibacteria bacterium]|jgi:hypothetical protein|nr:hypothetical protein [Candidatus Peregrinibacteria bacterium]